MSPLTAEPSSTFSATWIMMTVDQTSGAATAAVSSSADPNTIHAARLER